MEPSKLSLNDLNQIQLLDYVDAVAEEYRDVLKIRLKNSGVGGLIEETGIRLRNGQGFFDIDTGAIAVVEQSFVDPISGKIVTIRKPIILNNGFRKEHFAPTVDGSATTGSGNVTQKTRGLIEQGPFRETINGEKVTYIRQGDVRIQYKGVRVTKILRLPDIEIPISQFGEVKILANEHHAEMRIVRWAEQNGYRIVALAPTRGCCPHCALAMQQYFIKQNINIDDAIPKARQTRSLWRAALKRLRAMHAVSPPEFKVRGANVAALRDQFKTQMTAFRKSDPKLVRISRFLKVSGPAMLAFDATTSYAKAADHWGKGERDAAAETLAEFGGRAAGAFVGAEACALALGGCGSVIPGLGTTVGALAGILIGGAVGAYLGEAGARQMCNQIIDWTKGGKPSAESPQAPTPVHHKTNPEVEKLQSEMEAAGYSQPEIEMIGKLFENPLVRDKNPTAVLEQIGSEIVPFDPKSEQDNWITPYPMPPELFSSGLENYPRYAQTAPVHSPSYSQPAPIEPAPRTSHQPTVHQPVIPKEADQQETIEQRATPNVVATVRAELVKPQVSQPNEPWTTPASPDPRQPAELLVNELEDRADRLRERLSGYDAFASGSLSTISRDQFDADITELRSLQDQLTLHGDSAFDAHQLQLKMNELRSRYEQIDGDARWADDRKAEIFRKQQESERWQEQESRRLKESDKQNADSQTTRSEDHDLRSLEEREIKGEERKRREEQEQAEERRRQERDEGALQLDEKDRLEAAREAEETRSREEQSNQEGEDRNEQIRKQDDRDAQDRATRMEEQRRDEERLDLDRRDPRQQNHDARAQPVDDARNLDDERRRREEAESLRQNDDHRRRLEDEQSRHADDERQRQQEAAQRQLEDANRRLQLDESDRQRQQESSPRQSESATRPSADARSSVNDDARRHEQDRREQDRLQEEDKRKLQQLADAQRQTPMDEPMGRTDNQRTAAEKRDDQASNLVQKAQDSRRLPENDSTNQNESQEDSMHVKGEVLNLQLAEDERRQRQNDLEQRQRDDDQRRLQQQEIDVQRRQLEERLRLQQEAEERRLHDEELRRQQQATEEYTRQLEEWNRRQQEAEERRQYEEELRRQQQQADALRQQEEEWNRQQQEAEDRRRQEEEWNRQQQEAEERRRQEEEWNRQQREAEERRRQVEEWNRQQQEAEDRRRQEEEWRRQQQEAEDRRRDEERRIEEERKQVSGHILWPGRDPFP